MTVSIDTDTVTAIADNTAQSGGVIVAPPADITAYGVCWNKTGSPTTADPHTVDSAPTYDEVADLYLHSGENGTTYSYKRFTGGTGTDESFMATVMLCDCHDITFDHCIFEACSVTASSGAGSGYKVGNDLKIYTTGHVYNIYFNNCLFRSAYRMGAEINGRGTGSRYYNNVNFSYCTFEPSQSEPISYDDDTGNSGSCTVDHCVLGGAGFDMTGRGGYDLGYHQNLELNNVGAIGKLMTVSNNTLYCTATDMFNLQMDVAKIANDCGWVFTNNTLRGDQEFTDARAAALGCPSGSDFSSGSGITPIGNLICGYNFRGGSWSGNTFVNGNSNVASWMSGCVNVHMTGSSWSGTNTTHTDTTPDVPVSCTGMQYT
jgi:hypothetical protein